MFDLYEMAVMKWVPREPMEVDATESILSQLAPESVFADKRFDSRVAATVVGKLAALKMITRVGKGYVRTREGQSEYAASCEHYRRLTRLFASTEH